MFDTSVFRPRAIAAPRYGLFAASIAVHSGAILAAIALTLTTTRLPTRAPNQMEIYKPAIIPTIPQAYGHPASRPRPATAAPVRVQPAIQTAPNAIPDAAPAVTGGGGPLADPDAVGEPSDGPVGVPWGDPNSVSTAEVAAQSIEPPPITYTPGGEVTQARVLRRVEPIYPPMMIRSRTAATVTVHCTVDRFGNIRDPQIIRSSFPPFNEAVLEAVRQWTFAPGLRRGQPVDTYFELTVRFMVQ